MDAPVQSQQAKGFVEPQVVAPPPAPAPAVGDEEVQQLLRRAALLGGLGRTPPLVSFHSLFLAMIGGGSRTLDWFKNATRELQPQLIARALAHWKAQPLPSTYPPEITADHIRNPGPLATARPADGDRTPSVDGILRSAASYAATTGGVVAMRHLVVATLLAAGHVSDYDAWQLPHRSLLARYLVMLGKDFPAEAAAWNDVVRGAFSWVQSERLAAVLRAAGVLAEARAGTGTDDARAPVAVTVEDLVTALVAAGANDSTAVATSWLASQLDPTEVARLSPPSPTQRPTGEPRLSADVEAWLAVARRYALTCRLDELGLRHVVAALLSPPGPTEAKRLLRRVGGDAIELAHGLVALLQRSDAQAINDMATWRWLLQNDQPPPELRRAGYASDSPSGEDLIGIDTDVRALASVLAARDTRAPLSVGLFGEWGSGKSFFMRRMREHIDELADQSRRAAGDSAFCSQIAQIELNAWHYMDQDVWSSMVVHILECLDQRFVLAETAKAQDAAMRSLAYLDLERTQARAEVESATEEVERLDAELAADVPPAQVAGVVLQDLKTDVIAYVKDRPDVKANLATLEHALGKPPGSLEVEDIADVAAQARALPTKIATWWRETMKSPTRVVLVLVCALVPLVLAVVASVVASVDHPGPTIAAAVTGLAALIGAVKDIAAKAKPVVDAGRNALDTARTAAARILDDARRPAREGRANAEQALKRARAKLAGLDAQAAAVSKQLETPRLTSFRQYVFERARSGDYRGRQGVVAMVNRDFQGLSVRLADKSAPPTLDRIILYIDDLDRCTPKRVVDVLQAIHLMLSFDLFVVVVAVDSGWLLESLKAYYARQFTGTEHTSAAWGMRPQFYLEKIFQLPYTLVPLDPTRFSLLVGGLLADAVESDGDLQRPPAGTPAPAPPPANRPAIGGNGAAPHASPAPAAATKPGEPLDLHPRNLELTQGELRYMQGLGPLVSSPRAGKRLVNLYRIVRAGLYGDALAWFIDDHYQLTQVLLAAVVGCPDVTAPWLEQILTGKLATPAALLTLLKDKASSDSRFELLHDRLSKCSDVQNWPRLVRACTEAARYSFETGRLLTLVASPDIRPNARPRGTPPA